MPSTFAAKSSPEAALQDIFLCLQALPEIIENNSFAQCGQKGCMLIENNYPQQQKMKCPKSCISHVVGIYKATLGSSPNKVVLFSWDALF